jgi:hypothetical protein
MDRAEGGVDVLEKTEAGEKADTLVVVEDAASAITARLQIFIVVDYDDRGIFPKICN